MKNNLTSIIISWSFGLLIFAIGILNIVLVDYRPGLIYIFLSLIYFPPINEILVEKMGLRIPKFLKIILGIIIIWFTLGISDLGDMFV
ncbi:MAG: hypothetical protein V4548_02935 [Bacteroidota bacterium]